MLLGLMALVTVVMHMASSQERDSNVLRQGGTKRVQSEIVTSKTRAFLSCESGDMVVKVNFTEPFKGLMYAHRSRTSPCRVNGGGGFYYQLRIPLKGCGTWQESPRVFVNNITIRFHQALELEEDETKTVVCRYPPPLTPPPGSIHVITPVTPKPGGAVRVRNAGISEVEILIIICLLLFFSLLTVGIGIAYFCLKRRNIHLIRRKSPSSAPASQLTKLSTTPLQSSVLTGSILEHMVRIPRAIPYSASVRANTVSDRFYEQDEDTTESPVISRDSLESSPTTSTTSGGSADGIAEWFHRSIANSKTLLTIPKAILRRDDAKRRTLLQQHFTSSTTSDRTKTGKSEELEDQTITTLLEPEYSDNGDYQNRPNGNHKSSVAPVYAKVEKKKHRVRIMEGAQIMNSPTETSAIPTSDNTIRGYRSNHHETMKRGEVIIDKAGMKMLDEIISNTSSSTLKNNIDFTRQYLGHPSSTDGGKTSQYVKGHASKKDENIKILNEGDDYVIEHVPLNQKTNIATHSTHVQSDSDFHVVSDEKNLCIQDISDVYVTTTVETESTEIRTTIIRDVIEEHKKDPVKVTEPTNREDGELTEYKPLGASAKSTDLDQDKNNYNLSRIDDSSETRSTIYKYLPAADDTDSHQKSSSDTIEIKDAESGQVNITEGWNVIIRQKKPPIVAAISSSEDAHEIYTSEDKPEAKVSKPPLHFDIKIRTIPPKSIDFPVDINTADRRDSTELVDVPKLEMPHSIEKLRSVMAQFSPQVIKQRSMIESDETEEIFEDNKTAQAKGTISSQSKTVWWPENSNPLVSRYTPEPVTGLEGSDSYISETSLRERSSSEVLEKIPTLFSHKDSEHPVLERSTSEIVTAPDDQSIWIRDIPVLQSYSSAFLANIPIVTQGGFFHEHVSNKPSRDQESEKEEEIATERET